MIVVVPGTWAVYVSLGALLKGGLGSGDAGASMPMSPLLTAKHYQAMLLFYVPAKEEAFTMIEPQVTRLVLLVCISQPRSHEQCWL